MVETKNNIDMLAKKKNDILRLERKIQEMQEIKELKELQQEALELENRIKKYYTYDSVSIGHTIAKLMTAFEGIEYCCSNHHKFLLHCDYSIEPKYQRGNMDIHPRFKIKNIKQEKFIFDDNIKKETCYLPPSSLKKNTSPHHNIESKDIEYIQKFIDYLYDIRFSKSLEEISDEELEEILKDFLEITNDLQQQRKDQIARIFETTIKQQKQREFEKSCIIDRKLIINSLAYIVNHYEDNMIAIQEKYEEWSRTSQWSELQGYHKLIIKSDDKEVCFKTQIDSEGCYPDEEYCGVEIDINKNTNICFFDIKESLFPVLKNSIYAIKFIDSIEKKYQKKQNLTSDDIQLLLVNIANENKAKQRILRKKA